MEGFDLLHTTEWKPLAAFGFTNPFFSINAHIVTDTWILLSILFVCLILIRFFVLKKNSMLRFLILSFINAFIDLCQQTLGFFSFDHFCFITAIFTFILFANCLMLIPFLEEPTKNINTTLSLGIIAFLYIQGSAIKAHGFKEYIREYFTPIFVMFPLHVVGKLATIISMSFRLFGNIFGGATIASIFFSAIKGSLILELLGILSGLNILITLFFGLFEGFLQAFVFTMLTLTYLSIALQLEEEHEPAKEHA